MPFFVCVVPVCPVRAEASHRSEQVTQLLFGEVCELLERANDFIRIKLLYDKYEGWCQETQLEEVEQDTNINQSKLAGEWINKILFNDKPMYIPFGSTLPSNGLLGKNTIAFNGVSIDPKQNNLNEDLLKSLTSVFINTSYLWGGRSVFGIDCSGFTQIMYQCLNIPILRDASQQATEGDVVGFLEEVKCGDLAFFDNEAGKITHVGILLNAATIIHASGKVRKDTIDNFGIVSSDTGKRTHTLRMIKRIVR